MGPVLRSDAVELWGESFITTSLQIKNIKQETTISSLRVGNLDDWSVDSWTRFTQVRTQYPFFIGNTFGYTSSTRAYHFMPPLPTFYQRKNSPNFI